MFTTVSMRLAVRRVVFYSNVMACERVYLPSHHRGYSKGTNTGDSGQPAKDDDDGLLTHRIRQRREINIEGFNNEAGETSEGNTDEGGKKKKYNFFQKWLLIGLIGAMAGTTYFKANYGPTHKSGRQPAETLEMKLTQLAVEEQQSTKLHKSTNAHDQTNVSPDQGSISDSGSTGKNPGIPSSQTVPAQSEDLTVSFLLYPPGSQTPDLKSLCSAAGYTYLDPKELILKEIKNKDESEYGLLLEDIVSQKKKIPEELVGVVVRKAILMQSLDKSRFVIGGFPTSLAQAQKFDETVGSVHKVLFLDIPVAKHNNQALIETYISQSGPVIDYFGKADKVVLVQTEKDITAALKL
ncbi:hypothetical protein NADFUDRAFT_84230 [Nadsonia fulvescens var. elongata DSM 6958]|uniref:Uncharacterized protein n=1 Tax=Nadsonia fulvescens var. elongata DSM 6958 TaxID=857566 RepID=A0A1E3PDV2_9ASCO|nr:hypothetical protein NADFUDRAFT_84230 [Nadsonia fulvescens var. elongata DSM 6958]